MADYNHMLAHASDALREACRMQELARGLLEAAQRVEGEIVKAMEHAQALQERAPLTRRSSQTVRRP